MSASSRTSSRQNFIIEEIRSQQRSRDDALLQLLRSQICLRRVTLSFNLFFWITGPGLVGLGIWFYLSLSEFQPVVDRRDFAGPAYLILVAGGAAILAGIVGCVGGVNEHRHLLLLYSVLVMIVCSLELSATVYTFTEYDKARGTVRASFEHAVTSYRGSDASQAAIDKVQRRYSCCGIDGPSDWLPSSNREGGTTTATGTSNNNLSRDHDVIVDLPHSCCHKSFARQRRCSTSSTADFFQQGCLHDVLARVRWILMTAGWSSFAAACSQVLGLAVVCCFTRAVAYIYV